MVEDSGAVERGAGARDSANVEGDVGWARAAGAAGIASVVLVVAGRVVAGGVPHVTASAHTIVSYYAKRSHWHRQEAGLLLGALSMVFFLWFVGGLRARLRAGERAGAPLSSVVLAAGVAFAVLYAALSTMRGVIAFALDGSHAFRAAALDPQLVRSLEEARSLFFLHALVAGAVLMAAASLLALRTGVLARWLGAGGLAVAALVLVGAFVASAVVFLLLAWILVVGVVLTAQPHPARTSSGSS
jgi:hypothetical protein